MTNPDPFDVLGKLNKRIADLCKEEGFTLQRLAAIPGDDPALELMFTLNDEFTPTDEFDEMLKGMEEATLQEEIRRKAEEARENLKSLQEDLEQKLQRPSDGIL